MRKVLLIIAVVIAVVALVEYSVPSYEVKIDKQTTEEQLAKIIAEAKENNMEIEITSVNYTEDGLIKDIEGGVVLSSFVSGSFSTDDDFSTLSIHKGRGRFFPLFMVKIVNE